MGRAKNVAIAVVLLILAFLVILVIVTAVREYSASHQKPKDPDSNDPDSNDPDSDDTKHKKIPSNYFIMAGNNDYVGIVNGATLNGITNPTDVDSRPGNYTWTFGDSLEYVVKNNKPVTITFKKYEKANKVTNNGETGSTVTIDNTAGLFLIKKIEFASPPPTTPGTLIYGK